MMATSNTTEATKAALSWNGLNSITPTARDLLLNPNRGVGSPPPRPGIQDREELRRLSAARNTLLIAELTDSITERNRRALFGTIDVPQGEITAPFEQNPKVARRQRKTPRALHLAQFIDCCICETERDAIS